MRLISVRFVMVTDHLLLYVTSDTV